MFYDRFRSNAGPEFYTYKLKYIDDIDLDPTAMLGIVMACVFIPFKLITDGNVFYGILSIVGMSLFLILKAYARGKILKE